MKAALVAMLLAVDGGVPAPAHTFSAPIYRACPDASGAPAAFYVGDGGTVQNAWVLPDPRGARQACLLSACEEYRALNSGDKPVPGQTGMVVTIVSVAVVLAAGAGFAAGWIARR